MAVPTQSKPANTEQHCAQGSGEIRQNGGPKLWRWRCCLKVRHLVKETLHTFYLEPSCWMIPLAVCLLVLGLGLWGVIHSAGRYKHIRRETATIAATAAAQSFELHLKQLYMPCYSISALVQQVPQLADLRPLFYRAAPSLLAHVPSHALLSVELAPQGIISDSYPPDAPAIGKDLFREPTRRAVALETVSMGSLVVAGPVQLFMGDPGLAARLPIFLNNQTTEETYGANRTAWECPQCYDPVTGRKFWGFATTGIFFKTLVGPDSRLSDLANQGYSWVLRQPNPDEPSQLRDIAQSDDIVNMLHPVEVTINLQPSLNPSMGPPRSFTDEWFLYVSPVRGWQPVWEQAALAGIILAALAMGLLLCGVLVNRAQHIQVERDLVVSGKRLTETKKNLCEEKERLDALLARQYELLAIFDKEGAPSTGTSGDQAFLDRIEDVRRSMSYSGPASPKILASTQIQIETLIGHGSFGKVYQGYWHGKKVAIKTLVLPADMSGTAKFEAMAVMEAAISSSVSHPNIVQTYTYSVKPLADSSRSHSYEDSPIVLTNASTIGSSCVAYVAGGGGGGGVARTTASSVTVTETELAGFTSSSVTSNHSSVKESQEDEIVALPGSPTIDTAAAGIVIGTSSPVLDENTSSVDSEPSNVHCYEVMLVLEYCDKGTLRDAAEQGAFFTASAFNYRAILDTALDIARAMLHLHSVGVIHGDLKASNVLLTSNTDDPRGVLAKVADFGLSVNLDQNNTHLSSIFHGTMTHMAPEVLLRGQVSRASDVYAFGITMYELFTGNRPFEGMPAALLGHAITSENKRPVLPVVAPLDFRALVGRCWDLEPRNRPDFDAITAELVHMRSQVGGVTPPLQLKAKLHPPPVTMPEWPSPTPRPARITQTTTGSATGGGRPARVRNRRRYSVPSVSRTCNAGLFSTQVGMLDPLPEVDGEGTSGILYKTLG